MANENPKTLIDSFKGEYRFLSNYHMINVTYDGIVYPSTEHAYQAAKTILKHERLNIQRIEKPGDAKKEGLKVSLREGWDGIKLGIMYDLLSQKFQDKELKQKLLNTGSAILVEGNTWNDTYWGVCNRVGKNCLGKLLMNVREDILIAGAVEV